jgi:ATP-binding cassette subfamily B protein
MQLVLPLALVLGYGALRLAGSLFNELRDSVFARVRHGAMRKVSTRVLDHLHRLSLRYHLERKTGGISRDIERGTRSVSSLLNYMVFSILPVIVEVTLIAGILLKKYSVWFAVITFGSVIVYIYITFKITEWRMKYRVRMNVADSRQRELRTGALQRITGRVGGCSGQEPDLAVCAQCRPGCGNRYRCHLAYDPGHQRRCRRRSEPG